MASGSLFPRGAGRTRDAHEDPRPTGRGLRRHRRRCASDNGNTDADYVKVCKDPATGERVEDKKCDDDTGPASHSHSHPHWVYMPISRGSSVSAPGVGQKVPSGYSDSKPSSSSKVTTSDRSGGSYSRGSGTRHGGFGSGSKGGSGS